MAKRVNLDKEELVEVIGNGLQITIERQEDGESLLVTFASESGGRQIGVRQHPNGSNVLEVYLKSQPNKGFTLV